MTRLGAVVLLGWAGFAAALSNRQEASLRFLHVTDTHVTASRHGDVLQEFLAGPARQEDVAFVAHTGDVTELGTEEEFRAYTHALRGAAVPVYAVPGNHDVRWAPTGKEAFARACGSLYRVVRHDPCWFVFLDSTVALEHWGHFDGEQLRWLRDQLRRIGRRDPVFVFFHHWLGRDRSNIDNSEALMELLSRHNVVAIFVGHGHADLHWRVDGIDCFMARGLYQGSYHDVRIHGQRVEVWRVESGGGTSRRARIAVLSLDNVRGARLHATVAPTNSGSVYDVRLRLPTRGMSAANPDCTLSVNGSAASPLTVVPYRGGYRTTWSGSGSLPGWNTLSFAVRLGDLGTWTRDVPVRNRWRNSSVRIVWESATQSSIQGSPTVYDGTVFVGSLDGRLYAMDAATGRRRWSVRTRGQVYATPCVAGSLVIAGSTDHYVYAVNRASGRVVWRYDAGSPVFASAAASSGIVCVGSNRVIHGIELTTGRGIWRAEAGSFFQSRALAAEGRFILGGWDNALYALEAGTGRVAWRVPMGRTNGGRGSLSFYYSPAIASPAYGDGRVYICTNDGVLHALALADGTELWTARAPTGGDTLGYSSPLFLHGRVLVGGLGESGRGDCYAFDASTGKLLWRCSTGADNYDSSPAPAGPWVVIGSVGGRLTWLDPPTGRVVATLQPRPGYSFATPAADHQRVYTASMSGFVTAATTPRTYPETEAAP